MKAYTRIWLLHLLNSIFLNAAAVAAAVSIPNSTNLLLVNVLKNIFHDIIAPRGFNLLINTNFDTHGMEVEVNDLIDEALSCNSIMPVLLANNSHKHLNANFAAKLYFIGQDTRTIFEYDRDLKLGQLYTSYSKRLVVLLSRKRDEDLVHMMTKIFQHFFGMYIIDISILVNFGNRVDLYTYYPYRPMSCKNTDPVLIKELSEKDTHISFEELFPHKLKNLHGCPLSVILWNFEPFIKVKWRDDENDQLESFSGVDALLLNVVANKLNFTLKAMRNQPPDWIGGNIFRNGTITGSYKMLHERQANISVGGSNCNLRRLSTVSASVSYYQDEVILIFKASREFTPYETLIFPFDRKAWILCIVVFCLRLIGKYMPRNVKKVFPSSILRLSLLIWLFALFTLKTSYESLLFQLQSNAPSKPLPHSIEQMRQQNYKILLDQFSFNLLNQSYTFRASTIPLQIDPSEILPIFSNTTGKVAVLTTIVAFADYINRNPELLDSYRVIEEPVTLNFLCMYFPRLSYMPTVISDIIMRLTSFGIVGNFFDDFDKDKLPLTTKNEHRSIREWKYAQPVPWTFVKVPIKVLLIMHCVAAGLCVLEVLIARCGRRLKAKKQLHRH